MDECKTVSNRSYPHPSDAPEELTEVDLQAAWNDGYEAAKEEFHQDDSPQGRALRMKRKMLGIIGVAVNYDIPLTNNDVREMWNGAFLTNVMVPVLEHMKEENRGRQAQILDQVFQGKATADAVMEDFKELLHDANTLTRTIFLLQERRG